MKLHNWQVLVWLWPGLASPQESVCDSMVPIPPFIFFLPINVLVFSEGEGCWSVSCQAEKPSRQIRLTHGTKNIHTCFGHCTLSSSPGQQGCGQKPTRTIVRKQSSSFQKHKFKPGTSLKHMRRLCCLLSLCSTATNCNWITLQSPPVYSSYVRSDLCTSNVLQ